MGKFVGYSNSQRWKLEWLCMLLIIFCVKTVSFKIVSEGLYINLTKLSEMFIIKKSIPSNLEKGYVNG
jgi:hypothetical protein